MSAADPEKISSPRPSSTPPNAGPGPARVNGPCLVTGATGFIGSHLVERLVEDGCRVRVLVRRGANLRWIRRFPVELAEGDIRDKASMAGACLGMRNVFHFGALLTARTEAEFEAVNADGTRDLAEAFAERGEPGGVLVYGSSLAAGGPAIATASRRHPVRTESDPDLPITPYGRSKLAGERALFATATAAGSFRAVALRPAVVYGPRDVALLPYFRLVKKGLLPIVGPEGNRLSVIQVEDVVTATVAAAVGGTSGCYYLADGDEHGWEEIGRTAAELMDSSLREFRVPPSLARAVAWSAETLGRVTGRAPMLTRWKVREMEQPHWICSGEKAARELGFRPALNLEAGLDRTLSWYREAGWL